MTFDFGIFLVVADCYRQVVNIPFMLVPTTTPTTSISSASLMRLLRDWIYKRDVKATDLPNLATVIDNNEVEILIRQPVTSLNRVTATP